MTRHQIAAIPGNGIGPEVLPAACAATTAELTSEIERAVTAGG
jgi:isocitrate/isopropylmalate dehydrogenase